MIKIFISFLLLICILPVSAFCESRTVCVRNAGLANSGLALTENVDGIYGNPAGLGGLNQSLLYQVVSPLDGSDRNFISQSLFIDLKSLPSFGFSLNLIDNKRLSAENFSYSWFAAFSLLKIFSFGFSSQYAGTGIFCKMGGIISVPTKIFLSRLGLGWVSEGFDYDDFSTHAHWKGLARDAAAGGHLQFTFSKFLVSNLTIDTKMVEDYRGRRFGSGAFSLGWEQIIRLDGMDLALRTGISGRRDKPCFFSAGAGVSLKFLSFKLAGQDTAGGWGYHLSMTYRLGMKGLSAEKTKSNETKKQSASYYNYKEIPVKFDAVNDEKAGKFILLIDITAGARIDYWHLCVIALTNKCMVKSFENLGMPPKGVVLGYDGLESGKYRADLTVMSDDGKKTATRQIDFVIDKKPPIVVGVSE